MSTFFTDWVREQMKQRNWGLMELHRRSGLDAGGLSHLLNRKPGPNGKLRVPGMKTCIGLSAAFDIPLDAVLQVAGHSESRSETSLDVRISEITSIYDKFNRDNKRESLEFFRMLLRLQEQSETDARQDALSPQ